MKEKNQNTNGRSMSKFVEIKTCYAVLISLSDGKCILLDIVKDWIIAAIFELYINILKKITLFWDIERWSKEIKILTFLKQNAVVYN